MTLLRRSRAALLPGALLPLVLAACEPALAPVAPPEGPAPLATVPSQGSATHLDVASWNIEWFGSTANGPANETLQLQNARDVILGTDADIWGVAEITGQSAWNSLESQLTGYTGFLAGESVVTGGSTYYSSTEQKVGILYRSSIATLLGARIILTAHDADFAGRPPLEVRLRVTLNGTTEDVVVIVLHGKAFNDVSSWQKRQNASAALKSYLDSTYPTQKVIVVGDWNDDVDTSITAGQASPYANFVSDAADYTFPTGALSAAGVSSTTSYPDMIDHHLATNELQATYVAGSARVYRVDSYVSSYDATTSDHFPVLSRYTFGSGSGTSVTLTAPNGGESWSGGSTQFITWTSTGGSTVRLEYSLNGGGSWTLITSGTANDGSYGWTVPASATTSARVRVTDVASGVGDASNGSFTITTATPGNVILNEILANEPGSSTAGEFVELVNVGGTAVSIAGWTLSDASGTRHTFASGTSLQPGKAIVVFGGSSGIPSGTPGAVAASTGQLNLANGGDSVILRSGSTVKASYTYGSSLAGQDGVSMNRSPDASASGSFVLHTALGGSASPGRRANGSSF